MSQLNSQNEKSANKNNFTIGNNVVIGSNVTIGDETTIGNNVVIHHESIIGKNVNIQDNAVIGTLPTKAFRSNTTKEKNTEKGATIGNECTLGVGTVIYRGAEIGEKALVAEGASVRERTTIGSETVIGRRAYVENDCTIGARCKIQAHAYITAFSTLQDDVFIAPGVLTSNDPRPARGGANKTYKGAQISKGARIGVGAVLLPGVRIGEEAFVGAGSVVTKDVPAFSIVKGIPAKPVREVSDEDKLKQNMMRDEI